MPAFDNHANFPVSLVATAPSPASSGTSLVVTAGQGTWFPTASFNAVAAPPNTAATPTNSEIVRVTGVSTDTMTIVRAQEGTSAQSIAVGWQFYAPLTKKTLTDLENLASSASATATTTVAISSPVTLLDATGGSFTATLPTAVGFFGRYVLKAINTGTNFATIATTSAQTIDGASTTTVGPPTSTATWAALELVSDGSNWRSV